MTGAQDPKGAIRLSGRLICADAAQAEIVRRHLQLHLRMTRAEPGCLRFDVAPTDDPLIWRVEELFVDRAAFEAHQARAAGGRWGVATRAIQRDYVIAEL